MKSMKDAIKNNVIPVLLIIAVLITSIFSSSSLIHLQGNARVINYTGILRGATQRLVKQELYHMKNDQLIQQLDDILHNLRTGDGSYELLRIPSKEYQDLLSQVQVSWKELKAEILMVRDGKDQDQLFQMSEDYFILLNDTVLAAEHYSDRQAKIALAWLLTLTLAFVSLLLLFLIHNARQKKLSIALKSAENASVAKSDFLSKMSHEIRTPMNGIVGMTDIARESADDPKKVRDCLDKISTASAFLLSLINDILDMSRIENGRLELHRSSFDLSALISSIESLFIHQTSIRQLAFQVETQAIASTMVIGDELRLKQVLINLLSNSFKFTPPGGTVNLQVIQTDSTEQSADYLFIIQDTGVGMSEEFQRHMFDPFEQEEEKNGGHTGTGLGLAITKNILELMNGTISVSSKRQQGSRFEIRLCLSVSEPAIHEKTSSSVLEIDEHFLSGYRILLAEDNELNTEITTLLLEKKGAVVDHAWNGQEAIALLSQAAPYTYAIVLMDIQMPLLDGLETTKLIRSMPREDSASMPIIALTANAFQSDVDKALDAGMNGYLSKPIEVSLLYRTIASYLS